MSYVHFGPDSNVYLIGTTAQDGAHVIECCGCQLTADIRKPRTDEERLRVADAAFVGFDPIETEWDFGPVQWFRTVDETVVHLKAHQEAGHKVPQYAFDGVADPSGDWLTTIE